MKCLKVLKRAFSACIFLNIIIHYTSIIHMYHYSSNVIFLMYCEHSYMILVYLLDIRPKKKIVCFRSPDRPYFEAPTLNFFFGRQDPFFSGQYISIL